MKILIIGSRGFIGSACYRHFKKKASNNVYGADVVSDYNDPDYLQIDSSNADFKSIFKKEKFDLCINCSGAASVADSLKNPLRDYVLNVHNVALILYALREENASCRFLQLSSAAVYGDPDSLPVKESSSLNPQSPYGSNKAMSETICKDFYKWHSIKTCSIRIFSAYGPGLKKQFFWDCFQKARGSKEIILYGTGNESRDYIYVDDLVNAIDIIANTCDFSGNVVNVSSGIETTIYEAAQIFCEKYGEERSFRFSNENMPGYPVNWCADISTLRSMGYEPKISIEQGIVDFIKWAKELE